MNNIIKLIFILFLFALSIAGLIWLSGYFFLLLSHLNADNASFTTTYTYYSYYYDDAKTVGYLIQSFTGAFIVIMIIPTLLFLFPKKDSLFGDAKFATRYDLKKAGLLSGDGIIVGKISSVFGFSSTYLTLPGSLHVLLGAPTRSGKGVGIVVPNALTWPDSLIILDIKQENWNITSGYRSKHGQECFLLNFAPRNYKSHRWNPLYYISDDPSFRINDIQKIGQMLFPMNEHEAPIWQASSRTLWLGLILYLIESDDLPVTLGEALRQLTMGDSRLFKIITDKQETSEKYSEQCYLALMEYFETPSKTRGSVKKGFLSSLELLYNPIIEAVTSGNDFDLRDIRKKRMSIYVAISPDDLDRLAPLINLFFQQAIDLNTRELPEDNPALKYQCLLLPDEFTSMGKVAVLSKGISYMAGYGLRMLPIIQSTSQLKDVYGAEATKSFIDNHALRIIFPPKNIMDAKEISETLGTTTVNNKSEGKSRPANVFGKSSMSQNVSQHARPLMLPQEIMQLDDSKSILILENCRPILCDKITWFNDKSFKNRGNNRNIINWPSPYIPTVTLSEVTERSIDTNEIKDFENINIDEFGDITNLDKSPDRARGE